MLKRIRRAQSVAEYSILFAIVLGAVVGMQVYMRRSINARIKASSDSFAGITANFSIDNNTTAVFGQLYHYEPYYSESAYTRYREDVTQEHMGGGKIVREKVADISASRGYEHQVGAANASNKESQWLNYTVNYTTP